MHPEPRRIEQARRLAALAVAHLRGLLLDAVVARDGSCCAYCNVVTIVDPPAATRHLERTLDHIVPQSRGGTDDLPNLVCACRSCNARKGARPIQQFAPRGGIGTSGSGTKCQG